MKNNYWQLHCVVNPLLSYEYLNPVKKKKNILIIGSGPAVMQFITIASKIDHQFTLFKKNNLL